MREGGTGIPQASAAGLALLTPGAALRGSFTAAGYHLVPLGTGRYS